MVNNKGRTDNFSSGHSLDWVNHVYLCLCFNAYLLCFISAYFLFYFSVILSFLTTGIRAKGNLQENMVHGSIGSNGKRWKV
jgi:hypothetical protein